MMTGAGHRAVNPDGLSGSGRDRPRVWVDAGSRPSRRLDPAEYRDTGIGTFVGRLKGGSSHAVNEVLVREATFAWQGEYGVVSFGEKNLPDVVAYIQNQRERHAAQRLWDSFEQFTDRPQKLGDD